MQVEHLPAFPSPAGSTQALGFATFTPDFTTNRVVLTLNYNNSAILFSNNTSTFDVLGFTEDVRRGNIPIFHCLNMPEWIFVWLLESVGFDVRDCTDLQNRGFSDDPDLGQ
jgi:hypothetical protein